MGQISRGRQRRRLNDTGYGARNGLPLYRMERQRRRQASLPWFAVTCVLGFLGASLLVIAVILVGTHGATMRDVFIPLGVLLTATSCAPLCIGIMRVIERPQATTRSCGICRYYRPSADTYEHGACSYGRLRLTRRESVCEAFSFSERAMVRDRLSEAQHVINSIPE